MRCESGCTRRWGDAVRLLLAVLTAAAAVYRIPRHRGARLPEWALSGTLGVLALGLVLKSPGVYGAVVDATGAARFAQLVIDSCALLSAFGTQVVLLHMLRPPERTRAGMRRRACLASAVLLLMALFFFAADPVVGDADVRRMHSDDPGLLQFRVLYLAYLSWAFFDIARLCWRFSAVAGGRSMAAGLRSIAAGGAVGLGYVVAGVLQLVGAATDDAPAVAVAHRASNILLAVATLLVVTGSTLPALAARRYASGSAAAVPEAVESLWSSLTGALPDVVLPVGQASAVEETYRRVIEIEEARLVLRPLRTKEVQEAADRAVECRGVGPLERAAALEAAALTLAVDCRTASPECGAGGVLIAPAPDASLPDDRDLQSEVEWLSSVGRWHRDTQLVKMAREALAASSASEAARAH